MIVGMEPSENRERTNDLARSADWSQCLRETLKGPVGSNRQSGTSGSGLTTPEWA
jgi:hypothetical protein